MTYKCRYASLGPLTFRETAVSFYFLILVSLWFFQVAKFSLIFPGGKILWSFINLEPRPELCTLYSSPLFTFALFVIYSVGARIHSWLGRLLCSPKRGAFSWSDCFDLLCIDLFICVDLLCLDLLWLTLCWFGWWLKILRPCKQSPAKVDQCGETKTELQGMVGGLSNILISIAVDVFGNLLLESLPWQWRWQGGRTIFWFTLMTIWWQWFQVGEATTAVFILLLLFITPTRFTTNSMINWKIEPFL